MCNLLTIKPPNKLHANHTVRDTKNYFITNNLVILMTVY